MATQAKQACPQCPHAEVERKRTPWGLGEVFMVVLTAGLWVPLRMIYHAVASPWRCSECRGRIEAWHKTLGRAAAYGFGVVGAIWLAVPAFIAVIAVMSDAPSGSKVTQRTEHAIAMEKARREEATAQFQANRDQIVGEIKSFTSAGRFGKAVERAWPYLFLKDAEVTELHAYAQNKVKEGKLLASAKSAPDSDIDRRAEVFGELARLDPSNATYQQTHAHYAAKVDARNKRVAAEKAAAQKKAAAERAAAEKKLAAEKAKRDALVAKFGPKPQASGWDGSYREVERYLKRVMNDPDSLEWDGCTEVKYNKAGWLVGCNYRGRNGFGGMVRNANWFTIVNGRVTQTHDSEAFK